MFDEISGNRATLTGLTGVAPRFLRSETARYDDVAVRIAGGAGRDGGGRRRERRRRRDVRPRAGGDRAAVRLGRVDRHRHTNQPGGGTAGGVTAALPRLTADGFRFVRLSEYLPRNS